MSVMGVATSYRQKNKLAECSQTGRTIQRCSMAESMSVSLREKSLLVTYSTEATGPSPSPRIEMNRAMI